MEYIFMTPDMVKKYWHQIEVDELNESDVTNPFDYIEDCYHGKVKYGGCLVVIREDISGKEDVVSGKSDALEDLSNGD